MTTKSGESFLPDKEDLKGKLPNEEPSEIRNWREKQAKERFYQARLSEYDEGG